MVWEGLKRVSHAKVDDVEIWLRNRLMQPCPLRSVGRVVRFGGF